MNIKDGFTLTQTLTFDEETGEWEINTNIESNSGVEECSNLVPIFTKGYRYPTVKDCKEAIDEMFGYLTEDYREKVRKKKNEKPSK